MYTALSLKRLLTLLLWPFGLVLIALLIFLGIPHTAREAFKFVASALTIFSMGLAFLGGASKKWAPWRFLWRLFPGLNHRFFPDLNGVWVGRTSSNWPVIEAMKNAAEGNGGIKLDRLHAVDLRHDDVTLTITASFFALRVAAQLHSTGSKSHSLTERVSRDTRRDLFELYYVYRQDTPEPQATDEGSHLGAAALDIDLENWRLKGPYWTKRSWRQGLNTAGLIEVSRQSR